MKRCLLHFTKYLHFQMVEKIMLKIHSVPISCSSSSAVLARLLEYSLSVTMVAFLLSALLAATITAESCFEDG